MCLTGDKYFLCCHLYLLRIIMVADMFDNITLLCNVLLELTLTDNQTRSKARNEVFFSVK